METMMVSFDYWFLRAATTSLGVNLRYFGKDQQLKISKVADNLYSAVNYAMVYSMEKEAEKRECDCKFQAPKHTSYIGTVIKVGLFLNELFVEYCS